MDFDGILGQAWSEFRSDFGGDFLPNLETGIFGKLYQLVKFGLLLTGVGNLQTLPAGRVLENRFFRN